MKSLFEFIFESQEIITKSNKDRKKELEKWLKHKKYKDYVNTLNQMLEDPKAKSLLEDGFGGDLGDMQLTFSIKEIPIVKLVPTQKNIGLDKSLKYPLQNEESLKNTFNSPIVIANKPIVTFRENYIIDGHHSWLQGIILNPNDKILAFNFDGDISPIQMLKAVQGTIASVKAADNDNNGKLPSYKSKGPNIYDDNFTEKKIRKYIEDNLDEYLIGTYIDKIDECTNYDSVVNYLVERILDVKSNNYPADFSFNREDMPQIFSAGTKKGDKDSAMPDKKGSAMNKLKNNKVMKSIIK